ncbi:MAG: PAS domain S-box protein, partial [Nitrospiraceae bacterium]|nr:PAS domain S-box protein [Nitrospiraceae bacterium]
MGRMTYWRTAMLDITDRKRAEQGQARLVEDLSRSQQHFQALFNWIPSAVGISTLAEGRFIDVNEGFSRLTGYMREELIGRTTLELGLWADPSERAIVLREMQEQGYLHNREGRLRAKSGEIRSLMVSLHSIQLGSTPCLIYLGHDITERKRAEEALRESESRFRIMADTAPTLIRMSGFDQLCIYFNQVWLDYTGRTMEQELGSGWTDGVHPEDFDRCRKTYAEAFDRREPFQMEYRLRKADGQYGWVFDKGVPRHFPSGEFAGYIGTCIDI